LLEREASIEVLYEARMEWSWLILKQATFVAWYCNYRFKKCHFLDGVEVTKIIHKEFPSSK
jgi:hypothetical protein